MGGARSRVEAWIDSNLEVQGYRLTTAESRALGVGLRFPTAVCLAPRRHAFKLAAIWLLVVGVLSSPQGRQRQRWPSVSS